MTVRGDVATTEVEATLHPPVRDPAGTDPSRKQVIAAWLRDHRGLVVLLLIPFVVFGIPELFGWVFLDGDNFLQNLPMRVLVGRDLQHWSLPLWNPYLFGGTPLLGGFNAGAAYPVTWLNAILPTFTAWTLNLAIAYDLAVGGMYLFLRRQSISDTGALFGAASFAFAGYMSAQIVHIDLVEGAAWMPWTLVAVHGLTGGQGNAATVQAGGARATRGWIALLAISVGLSLLTGSAEAIIDSSVLVAIYAVGRLFTMGYFNRSGRSALGTTLVTLFAGAAGGLALGAAQWLPGLQFLSQSQRSASTYAFFSSGSLPVRLVVLLVSPFVMGTNESHPGPYVGPFNFEEVTGYVGLLALIAACSLFLKRFRTRPEARHWWIWYVIAAVGLLSAFGSQTPFGHVLYAIPIVNSERLLNRNLLLVDFSLAVLLAWWVHLLLAERDRAGDDRRAGPHPPRPPDRVTVRGRWRAGERAEIVVTSAPLAVMVLICLVLWVAGPELERLLGMRVGQTTGQRVAVAGLVTVGVLVAGLGTWLVLVERRIPLRRFTGLLCAFLVVDLVLFDCFVIRPPTTETKAQALGPMATSFRAVVGDGRFIIYDPDQFETSQLYELGQTDLNTYASFPSGQGYTALTGADYVDATGAHFQEDLNPATLAGGVWDDLNVSTLLSLPGYFLTPLGRYAGHEVRFPRNLNSYNSSPTPVATSYRLSTGQSRTWYFGGMLTLRSATVPVLSARPAGLRVGLVTATGAVDWLPASDITHERSGGQPSLHLVLARPTAAGGLVVAATGPAPATLGTPTASTDETGEVALDGRMQYGVTPTHWVFTGMLGSFAVFHNTRARGWSWLGAPGGGEAPTGSTSSASVPDETGDQQIRVHATSRVVLGRSETWSTGWRATIQPVGSSPDHPPVGPARTVPVVPIGVVQGVVLPGAGNYLVTFDYFPGSVALGLAVSALAGAALMLWAAIEYGARRRRRRGGGSGGVDPHQLIPG